MVRHCWRGVVGQSRACETSKPDPTCGLKGEGIPKIHSNKPHTYATAITPTESVSRIMAQKSSQNLNIVDNINSFNSNDTINSFNYNNVINVNTGISDEENQIREWLSPLKPQQRHQGVRAERLDGVGDWFLGTREFQRWSDEGDRSSGRVLFCSGGPGVGKTYLW